MLLHASFPALVGLGSVSTVFLFYLCWSEEPSGLGMCLAKGFLLQSAEGRWSCLVFLTSDTL